MNKAYTTFTIPQVKGLVPTTEEPFVVRQEYAIRSGFWLSIIDYCPQQSTVFHYEKDTPMMNFGYTIKGQLTNKVRSPGQNAVDYHNREGSGGILYQPQCIGEIHLPADQHIKVLHLHLEPAVFYQIFEKDKDSIPKNLDVAMNSERNNFCFRGGLTPQLQAILFRLLEGVPSGMPRHLFYESLALELIACQISEMNREEGLCRRSLSRTVREQVFAAAELLTENFVSPPTLHELTIATGLNANKLQDGFQQIYGCSVFRYLHCCKMEQSKMLFAETDMNVSEVATAVGYSNISHFGAAFRKFFGVLPKEYLHNIRK